MLLVAREAEGVLWVVAGCLFEVSLPAASGPWRWANPCPEVTLLSEDDRGAVPRHHFRFRAEAPGEVELRFAGAAPEPVPVAVRIAPERLA